MRHIVIIGCGYVGTRVAAKEAGASPAAISILTRSEKRAEDFRARGYRPVVGNLDGPGAFPVIETKGALCYYFAPPPPEGRRDSRMERFVGYLSQTGRPSRVVFISTTGIYGDCRGELINEDYPPNPETDRARRRLHAEKTLLTWARSEDVPVAILRVPGIYGPGRLPIERIRRGEPVLRESESPWSNRVHVDDLVRACVAAGANDKPQGVFNISDGRPTTMTDFFFKTAEAAGLPRPPEITREEARSRFGPGMLSYLRESKRIDNTRMREQLGVTPHFPDLTAGLTAIFARDSRAR